jgi:small GTP-binding protein
MSYIFKVILAGESGVGKSTFLFRLRTGQFTENIKSTIGVDFITHKVPWLTPKGQGHVTLQIWDLAGDSILNVAYTRGASVIFLMHDLTRPETAQKLNLWYSLFKTEYPNVPLLLIGSKMDLVDPAGAITYIQDVFFQQFGAFAHVLTSAKDGIGLEEVFNKAITKYFQK